ncbi:MAG: hypothetical protein HY962_07205 [Ignavibacteriae bacterium]|nr:hypothetical protein [Ignavibacteriota bacterium]
MVRLRYTNGATTTTELFRELSLIMLPETTRQQSTTLRGRLVDHLLAHRRVWTLTITTEGAINDVLWVLDFWTAEVREIQYPYDANDAVNWIQVRTADGRCPITFRDDIVLFPETGLELFAVEPS